MCCVSLTQVKLSIENVAKNNLNNIPMRAMFREICEKPQLLASKLC